MAAVREKAIFVWNDNAGSADSGEPLRGACDEHFAAIHTTAHEVEQLLQTSGLRYGSNFSAIPANDHEASSSPKTAIILSPAETGKRTAALWATR